MLGNQVVIEAYGNIWSRWEEKRHRKSDHREISTHATGDRTLRYIIQSAVSDHRGKMQQYKSMICNAHN